MPDEPLLVPCLELYEAFLAAPLADSTAYLRLFDALQQHYPAQAEAAFDRVYPRAP